MKEISDSVALCLAFWLLNGIIKISCCLMFWNSSEVYLVIVEEKINVSKWKVSSKYSSFAHIIQYLRWKFACKINSMSHSGLLLWYRKFGDPQKFVLLLVSSCAYDELCWSIIVSCMWLLLLCRMLKLDDSLTVFQLSNENSRCDNLKFSNWSCEYSTSGIWTWNTRACWMRHVEYSR